MASVTEPTATPSQPAATPDALGANPPRRNAADSNNSRPRSRPNHEIYASPLPIRTFPLPSFYPNNPVSWVHLIYAWLSQNLRPPAKEPSVIYDGVWDARTGSVHVWDPKSVRGLWESGFYGKGNLSRSEPNWLKRELNRRGASSQVIEQVTITRREERQKMKWERARSEQEALEQTRLSENLGTSQNGDSVSGSRELRAPVGPIELLALPNSLADLVVATVNGTPLSVTGANEGLAIPLPGNNPLAHLINGDVNGTEQGSSPQMNGIHVHGTPNGASACNGTQHDAPGLNGTSASTFATSDSMSPVTLAPSANGYPVTPRKEDAQEGEAKSLKRQKSVRFSPKVESTTFQHFDPPSSQESMKLVQSGKNGAGLEGSGDTPLEQPAGSSADRPLTSSRELSVDEVSNKEHLQLSPEEAFFLSFSVGALKVVDPATDKPLSTAELFALCRSHSYFPPRSPDNADMLGFRPDDPFLVQYVVYHHFRSLGWIVRHGIKFGGDWLLYQRGPIFDHAEFAVVVLPAYSNPIWNEHEHKSPVLPWHLLMGTTRVLSHVLKSLVLVYVDVPPPPQFDAALEDPKGGIAAALALYRVREVNVRKWSANRNR